MSIGDSADFIQWLGLDISIKILNYLDDPSDFVRISAVSRSWRQFVIENGFCKQLCLRMFPGISRVADVTLMNNSMELEVDFNNYMEREHLEKQNRVFAFLARGLESFIRKECIATAISASSTDNYPEESIENTLEPGDRVETRPSYWSSKGENDPTASEKLIYNLVANLCVITEIHLQPFQAYFQYGFPIYSAKALRFRLGHPKLLDENNMTDDLGDEKFIWTYTSPEYPMIQENCLQKFKLPEPALCVGGILQIELLGRVQRQEMDGLYYICISHVQAVGRPLSPSFDIEIVNPLGDFTLKYYPEAEYCLSPVNSPEGRGIAASRLRSFGERLRQRGVRGWEQMILNALLETGVTVGDDESGNEHVA